MQLRKWLYLLLAVLFAYYLSRHWSDLREVGRVILNGTWYWMLAAALFQVLHYAFHGTALRESFASLGIVRRRRDYLKVTMASLAVNVVAPSMNLSGSAFAVDETRRKGFPPVSSVVAVALTTISDGIACILGAILVAGVLFIREDLSSNMLLGVLLLTAVVISITSLTIFFWKRPHTLNWLFTLMGKKRSRKWKEEWHRITSVALPFKKVWKVLVYEVLQHFANFFSLICIFLAFGIDPVSIVPATVYVVGVIFIILSPTPMGIGFAEGGMVLAMVSQGMPEAQATAVTLAFRGMSFWLPFLIGTIFLHNINQERPREATV
ncbi:hypothetical protein BH11PAT4_BH11PAT4_5160 [soil metagenome]